MIIYQKLFGGGGNGVIESPSTQVGNDHDPHTLFSFSVLAGTLGINDIVHFEYLIKAKTSNGPQSPLIGVKFGGVNLIAGAAPSLSNLTAAHFYFIGEIANMGSLSSQECWVNVNQYGGLPLANYDTGDTARTGSTMRMARNTQAINTAVNQLLETTFQWDIFDPAENPSAQMITALVEIISP